MPKLTIKFEKEDFNNNLKNTQDFIKFVVAECKEKNIEHVLEQ